MKVRHVLKDGTEVPSVEGKVIKADDFRTMYEVIIRITMKEGDQKCASME